MCRYQHFYRAYNEWVVEIYRRQSYWEDEKLQIQKFMEKLEKATSAENKRRIEFWDSFGQYLPPSLSYGVKVSFSFLISCLPGLLIDRSFSFEGFGY